VLCADTVPDLSSYVRGSGTTSGSSPARAACLPAPRVATASLASTRRGSDSDSATQRTNPLSAFDTLDVCQSKHSVTFFLVQAVFV